VSYAKNYKTRYNENISDLNQPLLIRKDHKIRNKVALIPKLCQLTCLTNAIREEIKLMKDLATILHTNADKKDLECKNFFQIFS